MTKTYCGNGNKIQHPASGGILGLIAPTNSRYLLLIEYTLAIVLDLTLFFHSSELQKRVHYSYNASHVYGMHERAALTTLYQSHLRLCSYSASGQDFIRCPVARKPLRKPLS